jgi:hypothetical protein
VARAVKSAEPAFVPTFSNISTPQFPAQSGGFRAFFGAKQKFAKRTREGLIFFICKTLG